MNFNDLAGTIKNIHFSLYAESLVGKLAFKLQAAFYPILESYKQFYQCYLNIWQTASAKLKEASLSFEVVCGVVL